MEWQFTNDAPIYSQIVRQLRLKIASGELPPGTRLRSVRDLALMAGVNPNTMQRALAELERDGLLFSLRTSGRYVTEDTTMIEAIKKDAAREHIRDFLSSMRGLGYDRAAIHDLIDTFEKEEDTDAHTQVH